jgi:cytidylate kinase
MKLIKIIALLGLFLFTTGFVPVISLVGPGFTVLSSGNIYKAAAQIFIDQSIKKETGKSTLNYISDEIKIKKKEKDFNQELRELVERRILETRAKLDLSKFNQ